VATLIYSQDHGELLPQAVNWREAVGGYVAEPTSFASPYEGESFALSSRAAGQNVAKITNPGQVPLLFESRLSGALFAGGREDLSPRKDAAIFVLDGTLSRSPDSLDWNRP
jgi:hypothetical protein